MLYNACASQYRRVCRDRRNFGGYLEEYHCYLLSDLCWMVMVSRVGEHWVRLNVSLLQGPAVNSWRGTSLANECALLSIRHYANLLGEGDATYLLQRGACELSLAELLNEALRKATNFSRSRHYRRTFPYTLLLREVCESYARLLQIPLIPEDGAFRLHNAPIDPNQGGS
jgi:hypothetical protein